MMKITKIIGISVFLSVFALNLRAQKITILHTNDMHSKLTAFGPESEYTPLSTNDDNTIGGFARLATAIKTEKAINPENTVVVDAGDFMMGTIFHAAEMQTGFQISLMKEMGYDVITIGNHEFDYGPNNLAKMLSAAKNGDGMPLVVNSNIVFDPKSAADDELEALYKDNTVLRYYIKEIDGLKVGFMGIVGVDAADVAPMKAPVTFPKPIKAAAKLAKMLKTQNKVDLLICLSHSGFYPNQTGGFEGEDLEMAKKAPEIDVIISGHTHEKTDKPIKVGNTLIVQTGSYVKHMGRLDLQIKDKKVQSAQFKLIDIDDKIMGDPVINKKIEDYKITLQTKFFEPYDLTYNGVIAETSFDIMKRSPEGYAKTALGPFVADAVKYYIDNQSEGADVVMVASGTIRENVLKGQTGKITVPDVFRIMPLGSGKTDVPGYPIAKVYVTAHELKQLMDVLILSTGDDSYVFYSGIKTYYNPEKGMLRKVYKLELNGKELDISKDNPKLYSIAANTYLLSFIGRVKKISHGLARVTPKDAKGQPITDVFNYLIDFDSKVDGIQEGKEWLAVVRYLQQMPDTNNNNIPDMAEMYKTKVANIVAKVPEEK